MKPLRLVFVSLLLTCLPSLAFARGAGGGGHGGGSHGGGFHGGGFHSGGFHGWHGGGRSYYRPFRGGYWGWGSGIRLHGVYATPGYIWPYGVPWLIFPAYVPEYAGVMPETVAIQPPTSSVVMHAGEVTGMNVGQRFSWRCDNPQALVPTLENAGENALALVMRGAAPGEANCVVSDGETEPLHVHVVILPAQPTPTAAEPPQMDPPQ